MGLQLGKMVSSRAPTPDDLRGKVVAVDAPNLAWAFYSVQMAVEGADFKLAVRATLRSFLTRILDLAALGARVVVVFDGPPHPLKVPVLEARHRERAERGVIPLPDVTFDYIQTLGEALGVPIVEAAHDAEMHAAHMNAAGVVDVVATTDWDALAMGARTLLRGLSSGGPSSRENKWRIVDAAAALDELGAPTRLHLAYASVLMGCDYAAGIRSVGPKKALQRARDAFPLDPQDANLFAVENGWSAYQLLAAGVEDPPVRPQWHRPNADHVIDLLHSGQIPEPHHLRTQLANLSLLHDPVRAPPSPPMAPTLEAWMEGL